MPATVQQPKAKETPKKSIIIKEIITDKNVVYTLGQTPANFPGAVRKISYFNKYNNGVPYPDPCYVIFFTNDETSRRLVPVREVTDIGFDIFDAKTDGTKPVIKNIESIGIAQQEEHD